MTTHHPKFSIYTALQLAGLTTEKLLPTALKHKTTLMVEPCSISQWYITK